MGVVALLSPEASGKPTSSAVPYPLGLCGKRGSPGLGAPAPHEGGSSAPHRDRYRILGISLFEGDGKILHRIGVIVPADAEATLTRARGFRTATGICDASLTPYVKRVKERRGAHASRPAGTPTRRDARLAPLLESDV